MRSLAALALAAPLVAGCASFNEKVADSRQDRCQRADWAMVGERDAVAVGPQQLLMERYQYICGELFQEAPYKEGYAKGLARKPRPPT